MTVISPPLFQTVDGAYQGRHLGIPYRDILSEGVVGSTHLAVSQRGAGANMSVDVAAGVAWVAGDDNTSTQPLYRCYNDGTVNLAIATADGSQARIDRVIAEVRDSTFSGVNQDWRLRVITGTPAGSPAAPALPSNAISLATVSVPASDTTISDSQITDTRSRAVVGAGAAKTPACRAYRSSTQAVANASYVSASLTSESFDNDGMHDTATNPSRITANTPGLYIVTGRIYFGANATGARQARLIKNGSTALDYWTGPVSSAGDVACALSATVSLARGDYVEMQAWHNISGGGTLNIGSSEEFLHLDVHMISGS